MATCNFNAETLATRRAAFTANPGLFESMLAKMSPEGKKAAQDINKIVMDESLDVDTIKAKIGEIRSKLSPTVTAEIDKAREEMLKLMK